MDCTFYYEESRGSQKRIHDCGQEAVCYICRQCKEHCPKHLGLLGHLSPDGKSIRKQKFAELELVR